MKKLHVSLLVVIASGSVLALPSLNPIQSSLHRNKLGILFDCQGETMDCCDPVKVNSICDLKDKCWDDPWIKMVYFSGGYYGDFVFDRKMSVDDRYAHCNYARAHRVSIVQNGAIATMTFMDSFSVYGVVGAGSITVNTNGGAWTNGKDTNADITVTTNSRLAWTMGGSATLWKSDCFYVGVNGQFFRAKPSIEDIFCTDENVKMVSKPAASDNRMDYTEGQISVGCSAWIHVGETGTSALVPYAHVKWAHGRLSVQKTQLVTLQNKLSKKGFDVIANSLETGEDYGFALGVSFVVDQKASVTVEGRFMDERALHINGQLRF